MSNDGRWFRRSRDIATTTKQIAEQAGIREGLLYHYFPSKLGILNAVVTRRHTFVGEMFASIEGAEGRPAGEVMRSVGDTLIQTFGREVELARIILGEAQVNADVHGVFREMIESVAGRLAKYLEQRIQAGELRADLSPQAAATGHVPAVGNPPSMCRYAYGPDAGAAA